MPITDAYDYFIHLIACAIHKDVPKPLPDGITYEQVLSCAIQHDLAGFAYLGVLRAETKPDAETRDIWKQRYLLGIKRHSEQEAARQALLGELHAQGIATLELQGTRVKPYYPSPDLRMMGDIDMIIEKEHIPAAETILQKRGYTTVNQGGYEVDGYQKGLNIEIHTDFFPENHKYHKLMKEPFTYATVNEDGTAAVPDTVFWTYHLLHCLKHYAGKGLGVRRVLDLYFLAPAMAKTADTEYVNTLLEENGLAKDAKDLFAIADYWFGGKEPGRNIENVVAGIKSAGTQGNMRIYFGNKFKVMKAEGKRFVKLRYFLSLVFPTKERIYTVYPFCQAHHYPYILCWFHRAIRIPFKRGRMKMFARYVKNIYHADVRMK